MRFCTRHAVKPHRPHLWHTGALLLMVLASVSCGMRYALPSPGVDPREITGDYSVIVYGGRHANDLETIGFFDREDDDYSIAINAPDFDYQTHHGMSAPDALKYAREAVGFHRSFSSMHTTRLIAPDGSLVGYELRPLYAAYEFGHQDALDVFYAWRGKTLLVTVRLKPQVRRLLEGGESRKLPLLFRR